MEKAVNVDNSSTTADISRYLDTRGPLVGSRVREALIAYERDITAVDKAVREEASATDLIQQSITEAISALAAPEEPSSAGEANQTGDALAAGVPMPATDLAVDTKNLAAEAVELSSEYELSQRRRLADARLGLAKSWADKVEDDILAAGYKDALESVYGPGWMENEQLRLSVLESEKIRLQTAVAGYRGLDAPEESKNPGRWRRQVSGRRQTAAAILAVAAVGAGAFATNQQEEPAAKRQAAAIAESLEPTTSLPLYAELPVLPTTTTTVAPTTTTAAPTTTTVAPAPTTTHTHPPAVESGAAEGAGWEALRECESGGNYATNSGNGYYGAYQFDQRTWNGVARSSGRDDLVDVRPDQAAPADQDAMAQELYNDRGAQPWPVCGRNL